MLVFLKLILTCPAFFEHLVSFGCQMPAPGKPNVVMFCIVTAFQNQMNFVLKPPCHTILSFILE